MLEIMGLRLGSIGLFCLGFLFVPISRGSVLLRLIDIPFEHATRYHVWLGHLTMLIFTLHGLAYVVGWYMQGRCIQQVISSILSTKLYLIYLQTILEPNFYPPKKELILYELILASSRWLI